MSKTQRELITPDAAPWSRSRLPEMSIFLNRRRLRYHSHGSAFTQHMSGVIRPSFRVLMCELDAIF